MGGTGSLRVLSALLASSGRSRLPYFWLRIWNDPANAAFPGPGWLTASPANAAYHLFPQAMTVSGGTTNYFVTLNPANWVVTGGSWTNLLQNVSEFWIRMDLTSGCGTCASPETDWLDNVILKQRWLSALRIALRGETVLLDWTGEAGASLQKCGSLVAPLWQVLPGTTGASHYEEPVTNSAAFYRLIQ